MEQQDEVAVYFATAILKAGNREIEALTLSALAEEKSSPDLDANLRAAQISEKRAGAFGMEIATALIIPVVLEAVRQFFSSYQKEMTEKLGKDAASVTVEYVKSWFGAKPTVYNAKTKKQLADRIRQVGMQRGLAELDIQALVHATEFGKLQTALMADDR